MEDCPGEFLVQTNPEKWLMMVSTEVVCMAKSWRRKNRSKCFDLPVSEDYLAVCSQLIWIIEGNQMNFVFNEAAVTD